MKGLYRFLSPFSPDQSGAVSVLYELGGLIVVCDAGGCTGNICGFDEPRWETKRAAVFSAGLRDMDAILGRDDRLIRKIGKAVETLQVSFIALIGTPVPSVIATDYKAVARLLEKEYGLPAVYIRTTGIGTYELGEAMAYETILDELPRLTGTKGSPDAPGHPDGFGHSDGFGYPDCMTGVWGATPLNLPAPDSAARLRERLGGCAVTFGMDAGLEAFAQAPAARKNIVVSPSGIAPAERLKKAYGIPYEAVYPTDGTGGAEDGPNAENPGGVSENTADGRILVLHQQVLANAVRGRIERLRPDVRGAVDVRSFFTMDERLARPGETRIPGEDELIEITGGGRYRAVFGDPIFARALRHFQGTFVPLPHYAVSGGMYRPASDREFFKTVDEGAAKL